MVEELPCSRLAGERPFQVSVFSHSGIERNVQLVWNHFGDATGIAITPPEHPADISHHTFRFELAKRDDLRDAALAIFLPHVFEDLTPTPFAEIHIDVRR